MLLVCGVHARELLATDVCLEFLKKYSKSLNPNIRLDVFLVAN